MHEFIRVDFKLNTNNDYDIVEIINETTGEILQLVDFLELPACTYYINNLNFFYAYLLKLLTDNGFKNEPVKALSNNTYTLSYHSGKCSKFEYKHHNQYIKIINCSAKFGVEYGSIDENNKILNYALEHGRDKDSIGADAYNEFLLTIFRPKANANANAKLMRETYPILKIPEFETCKTNVAGYQFCIQGDYNNVYNYDIVSSYPSQLLCDTPEGYPTEYDTLEAVPNTHFKIIKFLFKNKKLNPNKIDFFDFSRSIGITVLTEHLFKLFKETYTADIEILKIWAFKTRKGRFNKFIQRNIIDGKIKQIDPSIAKYNKRVANALTGYLGRNTKTLKTKVNKDLSITSIEKDIDPIYLPAYLFAVGKAKAEFITKLNKYKDILIYANTDGFLTTQPIDQSMLNFDKSQELGSYKFKHQYSRIYIDGVNAYSALTTDGQIDNCISGMTIQDLNNIDQYKSRQFTYTVNIATNGVIHQYSVGGTDATNI